jgi:uncharacterized protein (DUF488 family)
MHRTLFTLGYEKRTLNEFIRILLDNRINVLVDVRETAWSHKPGFSKAAFRTALEEAGIEYVHADFAGNPKWLRGEAESHAQCLEWYRWYLGEFGEIVEVFSDLVDGLLAHGSRVCITCFERHADDCHRSIIATEWQSSGGRAVEHLAVEGCERLISA